MTTNDLLNEIEDRTAKVKTALSKNDLMTDVYIRDLQVAVNLINAVRKQNTNNTGVNA